MKTPVLCVHSRSNYKKVPGFDCWDEKRNALNYTGSSPAIFHPPCRLWSKLRFFATAPESEKQLAINAINYVRKYGGIVEHPETSQLWKHFDIKAGKIDEYGGFIHAINQEWFGFYTEKATYLYIVGCKPQELPTYTAITNLKKRKFENLTQKQRSETTFELIYYLKQIITIINNKEFLEK